MPEYFLRIIGDELKIKRMVAEDHDTAIRAVLKWEGENPDMDLTCGVKRIAVRRKSVWLLRPDSGCEVDDDFGRDSTDKLTIARGTSQESGSADPGSLAHRLFGWLHRTH